MKNGERIKSPKAVKLKNGKWSVVAMSILNSLHLYDTTGRNFAMLVNNQQAPGSYKVTFEGSNLASGMYLYNLTAGQTIKTRKLMLVK